MAENEAYVIPPLYIGTYVEGLPLFSITDDMLDASTVPETPPAVWSNVTTYALHDQRSVAGANNSFDVYISLQPTNLNHAPASSPLWWRKQGTTYGVYDNGHAYSTNDRAIDPVAHLEYKALVGSTGAGLADETKWQRQGPTNRWAALDLTSSTGTTAPSPMTFTIEPGKRVDAFGLAGLVADSFTVTVTKGVDVIYTHTESLSTRVVLGWLDWLTKDHTFKSSSSAKDMFLQSGVKVTITLIRASGDVTLGALFVNRCVELGDVETEPSDDAQNYSTFARDIGGTASDFIPKRVISLIQQTSFAPAERVPELRAVRKLVKASPAFWVGLPDPSNPYYESLQLVGVWRNFKITPGHPDARVDLDLEEA